MWETIKNNPLIKAIVVLILGILGFGLAFNIMFGGSSEMMGYETRGWYALERTLTYILMILIKLFFIVIVFTALTAAYKLCKKHLQEGGESRMLETYKRDPLVKALSAMVVTSLVIALAAVLFRNMAGGYGMGVIGGFGFASGLIFFVKLLLMVSIIGLVASIILFFIQYPMNHSMDSIFGQTNKAVAISTCSKCGTDIKHGWKCCPSCGEATEQEASHED